MWEDGDIQTEQSSFMEWPWRFCGPGPSGRVVAGGTDNWVPSAGQWAGHQQRASQLRPAPPAAALPGAVADRAAGAEVPEPEQRAGTGHLRTPG